MPGKRIPDLTAIAGASTANDDNLVIYDTSESTTKRILRSQLAAGLVGDLPYTPAGFIAATTVPTAIAEIATDLSANGGSSLVGFIQSGTGAVATTVQTKLRESVSVLDFGAVGDGVADDNPSFLLAAASGAKNILVPPGTYLLDGYFAPASNQSWIGSGNPTIKLKANTAVPRLAIYFENKTDVLIDGITIDGNGANQTQYNTAQKALVEIQSACKRITLRNVFVKNGLQWGVLMKGNTTVGIPDSIVFENVTTQGCLGTGTGGVPGSDGATGVAWVAATNVLISGGQSYDLFDVENNSATQVCQGTIYGRLFRNGIDIGDMVVADNCTFLKPADLSRLMAVRIAYGSPKLINPRVTEIDPQTNAAVSSGGWIGIVTEENNVSGWQIIGGTIYGSTMCGIGMLSFVNAIIEGTIIQHTTTDSTTVVSYAGVDFTYCGIEMPNAAGDPIRRSMINGVKGLHLSTWGGNFINLATADQRALDVLNCEVLHTNVDGLGKIYVYGARAQRQNIVNNNAVVSTSYTATTFTTTINIKYVNGSGCVVEYTKSNLTAPTDGTHVVGDVAYTYAPAASGFMGQVCTTAGTPGTWKTFGAISA